MDVEAVENQVLVIVDASNGRTTYAAVRNGLSYEARGLMILALRSLKAKGVAQKQNRIVNGKPIFEVFRIGAPLPGGGD